MQRTDGGRFWGDNGDVNSWIAYLGVIKKRTVGIRRNADRSFPLERAESALLLSELSFVQMSQKDKLK